MLAVTYAVSPTPLRTSSEENNRVIWGWASNEIQAQQWVLLYILSSARDHKILHRAARHCAVKKLFLDPTRATDWVLSCLPRANRNRRFLFVKNESIKFCCSRGVLNLPDVVEASVLVICTVFHVRSVSCRCLYLGFRALCAGRVTPVTCSKLSTLGVPLEIE